MIGFFLKKAFFDGWDNLISIVLVNVLFVALLAAGYGALSVAAISSAAGIILLLLWFVLLHFCIAAVSFFSREYAFYQRPGFAELVAAFKESWKYALLLCGVNLFLVLMSAVVIPFYASLGSILGVVIVSLLFWVVVVTLLSMQFYLPLAKQLGDKPLKALKKSFIIFLDNTGFAIFFGIYTLVNLILSIVTALLVPGVTGILASGQVACKLLMFKYDYLENESEADRKHIPWTALLFDEREKVGHRSLKGMIFPWKE